MSYAIKIKQEISKIENLSSCCYHAQVYGLVLFAHFSKYNLSITSENSDVFDKIAAAELNVNGEPLSPIVMKNVYVK